MISDNNFKGEKEHQWIAKKNLDETTMELVMEIK